MIRMSNIINIGTECFALLTTPNEPEMLLPVQIKVVEKYNMDNNITYKVKIIDIFETDFNYLKDNMSQLKVSLSLGANKSTLIKKSVLEKIENKMELLTCLNDKLFFIENNSGFS